MELSYDNRNDSFIPSLADDENSETGEIVSSNFISRNVLVFFRKKLSKQFIKFRTLEILNRKKILSILQQWECFILDMARKIYENLVAGLGVKIRR